MSDVILHDYWRSSASYRVRIALSLKGIDYRTSTVDLLDNEHHTPRYKALNPQSLVPTLIIDGLVLTQSLAIIQYLDDTRESPRLIPEEPIEKHRVLTLAHIIAMDIHPVCNLHVAEHVVKLTGGGSRLKKKWMKRFITRGLTNIEEQLKDCKAGQFCHGDSPTIADCCLIPQVYNALRWEVDLEHFETIRKIALHCGALPEFASVHPDMIRDVQ
ncbi:MAG: maleylacetoacetate isomerase [Granulosicoccus sp.]|nr:maleylacetoacetate isomerase [Granulosicoccus sp.]